MSYKKFNELTDEQKDAIARRKRNTRLDYNSRLNNAQRLVTSDASSFRIHETDDQVRRYQEELDRRYP
jgi:hypothetical protein